MKKLSIYALISIIAYTPFCYGGNGSSSSKRGASNNEKKEASSCQKRFFYHLSDDYNEVPVKLVEIMYVRLHNLFKDGESTVINSLYHYATDETYLLKKVQKKKLTENNILYFIPETVQDIDFTKSIEISRKFSFTGSSFEQTYAPKNYNAIMLFLVKTLFSKRYNQRTKKYSIELESLDLLKKKYLTFEEVEEEDCY